MPPAHRLSPVPFLVCPLPLRRTLPLLRITGALTPPSRAKGPAAQPLLQQEIFREGGHGLHYARALRKGLLRGGGVLISWNSSGFPPVTSAQLSS